jgi:hypothetical protein
MNDVMATALEAMWIAGVVVTFLTWRRTAKTAIATLGALLMATLAMVRTL